MLATALFTLGFLLLWSAGVFCAFHYGIRFVSEALREKRANALTASFDDSVKAALDRMERKAKAEIDVAESEHPAGPPLPMPNAMKRRLPRIPGFTS